MKFRDYSNKTDEQLFQEYLKAKKMYEISSNKFSTKFLMEMNFLKAELFKRGVFEELFKPTEGK